MALRAFAHADIEPGLSAWAKARKRCFGGDAVLRAFAHPDSAQPKAEEFEKRAP